MPNLFEEPGVIISQLEEHVGGWCDSGHKPPPLFRREGPDSPELPMRFFHVNVPCKNVAGTYCEPCLIVANHMARLKKQGNL